MCSVSDRLLQRGVVVDSPEPGVWVVPAAPIAARDVTIEPDLSNAGPFLAAALGLTLFGAASLVVDAGWPRRELLGSPPD